MRSGIDYGSRTNRPLEIGVGLVLAVICVLLATLAVFVVVASRGRLAALVFGAACTLLLLWLLRISIRLLRGQRNPSEALLSPTAIYVGAAILLAGGLLSVLLAVTERNIRLAGISWISLPAAYYAWRYASERRRGRDA
jgi:uncharacterized SAM-binding protein YcdF (DUF218 family)